MMLVSPTNLKEEQYRCHLSPQMICWIPLSPVNSFKESAGWDSNIWGILVKLVIRISSGHQKIKIISFVKYVTFAWFLLCNNVLWLKNWFGNLITHLANILWPVFGNSPSRGDTQKKYTAHLATKSILSAQIRCKRHHQMLKVCLDHSMCFLSFSSDTCSIKFCPEEISSGHC